MRRRCTLASLPHNCSIPERSVLEPINDPQLCHVEFKATLGPSRQQVLDHCCVLTASRSQPQDRFTALGVHDHSGNDVVPGHDDAIDLHGNKVGFAQIPVHPLRPGLCALLDELARDDTLGNAQLISTAVHHPPCQNDLLHLPLLNIAT